MIDNRAKDFDNAPLCDGRAMVWRSVSQTTSSACRHARLDDASNEGRYKLAPVAQLDRVPGYEPGGREFESLRARQ